MTQDLAELRRLVERATAGPWRIDRYGFVFSDPASHTVARIEEDAQIMVREESKANAAFIAAARTAVPALIAEVERLGAELAALQKLTALQAEDEALWAPATYIETAYTQQSLRILTRAIEGDMSFENAEAALKEMMP